MAMCPVVAQHAQESPVASKIKDAFMAEKGLAGKIKKLPMDKVFDLKNVKAVRMCALQRHGQRR
jgi:hypothetical protein